MSVDKNRELVLCVAAAEWLAEQPPFPLITRNNIALASKADWPAIPLQFLERGRCEDDPTYRQLIPYVVNVFHHSDGRDGVMAYRRKSGGEVRLDAKYSIGIGGHINPRDATPDQAVTPLAEFVTAAYYREECEELPEWLWHEILPDEYEANGEIPTLPPPTYWIVDNTNDVGRVHLGLLYVHHVTLRENEDEVWQTLTTADVQLDGGIGRVVSPDELGDMYSRMEGWSQAVYDVLPALLTRPSE